MSKSGLKRLLAWVMVFVIAFPNGLVFAAEPNEMQVNVPSGYPAIDGNVVVQIYEDSLGETEVGDPIDVSNDGFVAIDAANAGKYIKAMASSVYNDSDIVEIVFDGDTIQTVLSLNEASISGAIENADGSTFTGAGNVSYRLDGTDKSVDMMSGTYYINNLEAGTYGIKGEPSSDELEVASSDRIDVTYESTPITHDIELAEVYFNVSVIGASNIDLFADGDLSLQTDWDGQGNYKVTDVSGSGKSYMMIEDLDGTSVQNDLYEVNNLLGTLLVNDVEVTGADVVEINMVTPNVTGEILLNGNVISEDAWIEVYDGSTLVYMTDSSQGTYGVYLTQSSTYEIRCETTVDSTDYVVSRFDVVFDGSTLTGQDIELQASGSGSGALTIIIDDNDDSSMADFDYRFETMGLSFSNDLTDETITVDSAEEGDYRLIVMPVSGDGLGATFVDFSVTADGSVLNDNNETITELTVPIYDAASLGMAKDYNESPMGQLNVHLYFDGQYYLEFTSKADGNIDVLLPTGTGYEMFIDGHTSDVVNPWYMDFDIDANGDAINKDYTDITFGQVLATGVIKLEDTGAVIPQDSAVKVYDLDGNFIREFDYYNSAYMVGNLQTGVTYNFVASPYDTYGDLGYGDSDPVSYTIPASASDPLETVDDLILKQATPDPDPDPTFMATFDIVKDALDDQYDGDILMESDFEFFYNNVNHPGELDFITEDGKIHVVSADAGEYEMQVWSTSGDYIGYSSMLFFQVVDNEFQHMNGQGFTNDDFEFTVAEASKTINFHRNSVAATDISIGIHKEETDYGWHGDYQADENGDVHLPETIFSDGDYMIFIMAGNEHVPYPIWTATSGVLNAPDAIDVSGVDVTFEIGYYDDLSVYHQVTDGLVLDLWNDDFFRGRGFDNTLTYTVYGNGTYQVQGFAETYPDGYTSSDVLDLNMTDGTVTLDGQTDVSNNFILELRKTSDASIKLVDVEGLDGTTISDADIRIDNIDHDGEMHASYEGGQVVFTSADAGDYKMVLHSRDNSYYGHSRLIEITVDDSQNITFTGADDLVSDKIQIHPATNSIAVNDTRLDESWTLNAGFEVIENDSDGDDYLFRIDEFDGSLHIATSAFPNGDYTFRPWGNDTFYDSDINATITSGVGDIAVASLDFGDRQFGVQLFDDSNNQIVDGENRVGIEIDSRDFSFGFNDTFYFAGLASDQTVQVTGWSENPPSGLTDADPMDVVIKADGSVDGFIKEMVMKDLSEASLMVTPLTGSGGETIYGCDTPTSHKQGDTDVDLYVSDGQLIIKSGDDGDYVVILHSHDSSYYGSSQPVEFTISGGGTEVTYTGNDLNNEGEIVIYPATVTIGLNDLRSDQSRNMGLEIRVVEGDGTDWYSSMSEQGGYFHFAPMAYESGNYTFFGWGAESQIHLFDVTFSSDGNTLSGLPSDLTVSDPQVTFEIVYDDNGTLTKLQGNNDVTLITDSLDIGFGFDDQFKVADLPANSAFEIRGKNHDSDLEWSDYVTVEMDGDGNVVGDSLVQLQMLDPTASAQAIIPVKGLDGSSINGFDVSISHRDHDLESNFYEYNGQLIVDHATTGNYYLFLSSYDADYYGHSRLVEVYIDGDSVTFTGDSLDVDNGAIIIYPETHSVPVNDLRTDDSWDLHESMEVLKVDGDNQDWAGHIGPQEGSYRFAAAAFEDASYKFRRWANDTVYVEELTITDGSGLSDLPTSIDYTDRQFVVEVGYDDNGFTRIDDDNEVKIIYDGKENGYGFGSQFYFAGIPADNSVIIYGLSGNAPEGLGESAEATVTIKSDGTVEGDFTRQLILLDPTATALSVVDVRGENDELIDDFDQYFWNTEDGDDIDAYVDDNQVIIKSADEGDYLMRLVSRNSAYYGHTKLIDIHVDGSGTVTYEDGALENNTITLYQATRTIPLNDLRSDTGSTLEADLEIQHFNGEWYEWYGNMNAYDGAFRFADGAFEEGDYDLRLWGQDLAFVTPYEMTVDGFGAITDAPSDIDFTDPQFSIKVKYVNDSGETVYLTEDSNITIKDGDQYDGYGFGDLFYIAGISSDKTVQIQVDNGSKPEGYASSDWIDVTIDSDGNADGAFDKELELRNLSDITVMKVKLVDETGADYLEDLDTTNYGEDRHYEVERFGAYMHFTSFEDGHYNMIHFMKDGNTVTGSGFYEFDVEEGTIIGYDNPLEIVMTVKEEAFDFAGAGKYHDQVETTMYMGTYLTYRDDSDYPWPNFYNGWDTNEDAFYYLADNNYVVNMTPFDTTYGASDYVEFSVTNGVSSLTEAVVMEFPAPNVYGLALDENGGPMGGINPDGTIIDDFRPLAILYLDGDMEADSRHMKYSYMNGEGRFSFANVADGTHTLIVKNYQDDYMNESEPYTVVVAGEVISDLNVTYALAQVKINVTLEGNSWLDIMDSEGNPVEASVNETDYGLKVGHLDAGTYTFMLNAEVDGVYYASDDITVTIGDSVQEVTAELNEVESLLTFNLVDESAQPYQGQIDLTNFGDDKDFEDYWTESSFNITSIEDGNYTFLFHKMGDDNVMMGSDYIDLEVISGKLYVDGSEVTEMTVEIKVEEADVIVSAIDADGLHQDDFIFVLKDSDFNWPRFQKGEMIDGVQSVYFLKEDSYSLIATPLFKEGGRSETYTFTVDADGVSTSSGQQVLQFAKTQVNGTVKDLSGTGIGDLGTDPMALVMYDVPYGEINDMNRAYVYDGGTFNIGGLSQGDHTVFVYLTDQDNYVFSHMETFTAPALDETVDVNLVVADKEIVLNMTTADYDWLLLDASDVEITDYGYRVLDTALELGGIEAGDIEILIKGKTNDEILAQPISVTVARSTVQTFDPVFVTADYTSLDEKIAEANSLVEQPAFTQESRANLQVVLDDLTLMTSAIHTQADIDAAVVAIQTALDLMVYDYDKSGLIAEIDRAEAISDTSGMTAESVTPFETALAAAIVVRDEPLTNQDAINVAEQALIDAILGLDVVEPVITLDVETPTKENVLVTIEGSYDIMISFTSADAEDYVSYEDAFEVDSNKTLYAKSVYGDLSSDVVTKVISNIDKDIPLTPVIQVSTEAITSDPVLVSVTHESVEGDSVYFKVDEGDWALYETPHAMTSNGTFYAEARDLAGNISELAEKEISNIDTEAPSLILDETMVTVDVFTSYVKPGYITIDDASEVTVTEDSATVLPFDTDEVTILDTDNGESTIDKVYTVTYTATDEANNTTEKTVSVKIVDREAPLVTVYTALGDEITDPITVVGSTLMIETDATDNVNAEITTYRVEMNAVAVDPVNDVYTLDLVAGDNYIYIEAEDASGNIGSVTKVVTMVKPSLEASTEALTNQDVDMTVNLDGISDLGTLVYALGNGSEVVNDTSTTVSANDTVVTVQAKIDGVTDFSDLVSYTVENIDKIDPDVPTIVLLNEEATNDLVYVRIDSEDAVTYQLDGGDLTDYEGVFTVDENDVTITAIATDLAGNTSEIASHTVTNIDKSVPVINSNDLYVNGDVLAIPETGTVYVKAGDVLQARFESSDTDATGYVKVNEQEVIEVPRSGDDNYVAEIALPDSSSTGNRILLWMQDDVGNKTDIITLVETLTMDVKAPVVSMSGGDMTIEVNSTFVDPGAEAFDDVDQDLTITADSTVNSGLVGDYTVTYKTSDDAENESVPVIRYVTVSDTIDPVITTTLSDKTVAKDTLSFEASAVDNNGDPLVVVTLNGTPQVGDTNYSVSLEEGENTLVITATDLEGNSSSENFVVTFERPASDKPILVPSTTEATNQPVYVFVEHSAAEVEIEKVDSGGNSSVVSNYDENTGVEFSANGALNARVKETNLSEWSEWVTYTVSNIDTTPPAEPSASADILTATNTDVIVTLSGEGDILYSASEITGGTDNKDLVVYEGPITLTQNATIYAKAIDAAGNETIMSSGFEITNIDKVAPVGNVIYSNVDPTNDFVVATLSVNEDFEMVSGERFEKFESNGTRVFTFEDLAGNTASVTASVTNIDLTPPAVSDEGFTVDGDLVTIVKGGDVLEISASIGEEAQASVDFGTLIFDEPLTYDAGTVTGKIIVPPDFDGTLDVTLKVEDLAGNVTEKVIADDLLVDNTKPLIQVMMSTDVEYGDNDFVVSDTLQLDILTDGTSIYMGTNAAIQNELVTTPYTVDLSNADGDEHTLYFKSVDLAGNESDSDSIAEITFKWDKDAPEKPVLAQSVMDQTITNEGDFILRGSAEAGTIKIDRVAGTISETVAEISTGELVAGYTVPLYEGTNKFTLYVSDLAGNMLNEGTTHTVEYDSIQPLVDVSRDEVSGDVTVTSDENPLSVETTINGESYDLTLSDSGSGYEGIIPNDQLSGGENILLIDVEDAAGNVGVGRLSFIKVTETVTEEKQVSEGVDLTGGTFSGDADLSVRTIELQASDNSNFIGEPMDFDLSGDVTVGNYVLIDLDIGLGHPDSTRMYYYDSSDNWVELNDSVADGDSMYNGTADPITVTLGIEGNADKSKEVTIESGHLVAIMYHFSPYGVQSDTTKPVITVNTTPPSFTTESSFDVSLTVSEPSDIYVDGIEVLSNVDGNQTVTLSLNEGEETHVFKAIDLAGNESDLMPTITTNLDTTKPVIEEISNSVVNNATYNLDVSITETNFDYAQVTMGETTLTTSSLKDFNYNIELTEGENTINVVAYDEVGNLETETVVVTLDTQGPVIETSISDGDILASDIDVTVDLSDGSYTATLNNGVEDLVIDESQADHVKYTVPENSRATYTLTIDATDDLGNASREVTSFIVDMSAPEITVSDVAALVNRAVTLSIDISPSDADYNIILYKDDERVTNPVLAGANGSHTLDVTEDGDYRVSIDAISNGVGALKTVEFTLDQTPPVITVSSITNDAVYTTETTVTFNVSDASTYTASATIQKDLGAVEAITSGSILSDDGDYILRVNAEDAAGNSADEVVRNFNITIEAPVDTGDGDDDTSSSGGSSSGGTTVTTPATDGVQSEEKQVITAKKESLVFADTNIVMNVKQAGLPSQFEVTVKELTEEAIETMTKDVPMTVKVASKVYQFQGTEDTFTGKIEISIPYDPELVTDPKKLSVYVYDETTASWIAQGGKVDPVAHTVTFKTKHFSYYTILEGDKTFKDIGAYTWATDSIETLASRDIIGGYGNGFYRPGNSVKRAEFAKMITLALALTKEGETSFTDIDGMWYEEVIEIAASNGIMSGYNNKANPEDLITREQMAVMIINAYQNELQLADLESLTSTFDDFETVSGWAQDQVAFANTLGIINGKGNNMFAPKANATRAEAAAMIYRLLDILEMF